MGAQDQKDNSKELSQVLGFQDTKKIETELFSDAWLRTRSPSELIKIIQTLTRRIASDTTLQIDKSDLLELKEAVPKTPLHLEFISDVIIVPVSARAQSTEPEYEWELVLFPDRSSELPLRLKILDDFTIGRAKGSRSPDLDLDPLGAAERGVSRLHASIRATVDGLFVVDLGSTNGTYYKARKLRTGTPVELSERASIAFGSLVFSITKIEKKP